MWLHGSLGWLLVLAWYVCAAPEPEHVAASFAGKTEPEPPVADHDEESAGVGACSQCPVRLLEVVNEEAPDAAQLQLNDAGLRYLESQRSPLFLIPALGVYRGGKSLLLNRLMQRQAPYAQSFGIGHGQETFTRGIEICAEALPNHGGTVVWMDTEGLFSSEDARSAYGPKIFSLALLFSSVVLLNNLKVLNQQFFVFFEEQQQVARILREGLRSEGMRSDLLLPENLPIVWVLQQPINFAASAEASRHQLDSFLTIQDKARERIKDSFKHLIHEVPTATHDARQWSKLDQVSDNQLLLEYVSATKDLRYILLTQLQTARPLQAPSVAAQLRMYVDLVQKDHFSISLAKEAFEDSHVAQLCESFGQNAQDLASGLPAVNLSLAMNMSEQLIQEQRDMIIRDFHLGDAFLRRLQQCLDRKRLELEDMNGELVLEEWQKDVHKVAESGRCFILSKLALELPRYRSKYGPVFSKPLEAKARDFALQVQRSRVAGCVLLRHFAVPVAPWFAWPIMALYIRQGVLSGILTMGVHGVVLAGIYSILQFMGRLPFYVDLDYQVLRQHPGLLEWVMRYPQIPWDLLSQICGILGWIRVAWILGSQMFRPVETRTIGQLSNLELKVNTLLERTEADVKEKIVTSALEAALSIDSNDPAAAALSLVKGLMVVSQVGSSDTHFAYLFEAEHRSLARATVKSFHFPDKDSQSRCAASCKKDSSKLLRLAISNEWDELIPAMVVTLEKLSGRKDVKDGVTSSKPSRRLFQDVEDDEVEEAQEQSCCGCFCRFCIVLLLVLAGFVGAAWLLEFSSRAGLLPTAESTLPNSKAS
ncbi:Guanylate-binding protein 1 (GTP-binding protein 1) (GBP-1) (mGBP-1) (mGBP1) (Guanine nucleotide-binding protein 1) (Interferon-gamma-inducible protein MAG-1) (Interferon-induced guanylate-binding protein 1) [Durusdinium trenchii]|uniref:Guanylate-binding protein N-terminal domain-containing protein n=1 Tax=Durusdinium trenchii TaxID=1381693 RepID=A0ABP0KX11_9DINO